MKKIIFLLLIPIMTGCCGGKQQPAVSSQTSEADVAAAVDQLMKGFMAADKNILQTITADALVYGHSSGKVQNKSEFVAEIISGEPLKYFNIELLDQTIQMSGDAAVVRHIFTAETKNTDGEPGSLRIGVMQVWQLQNGAWKLLARQAYRL
jgi:ketosteroid isomerase-like protein